MSSRLDGVLAFAKELYLKFKPQDLAQRLSLPSDARYIYVNFLGERFALEKQSGDITNSKGEAAVHYEHLTIFDALCRDNTPAKPTGRFVSVNSLGNMKHPGVSPEGMYREYALKFSADTEGFATACKALGGRPFPVGDFAFTIDTFDFLPVTIQLWEGDDEFPAQLSLLWDESTLDYLKYETVWFVAHLLFDKILYLMGEKVALDKES